MASPAWGMFDLGWIWSQLAWNKTENTVYLRFLVEGFFVARIDSEAYEDEPIVIEAWSDLAASMGQSQPVDHR